MAGLDPLAAELEVGEPVPLLLLPELALLSVPEASSRIGTLIVYTGGEYCVKPVQVGYEIVSPASKEVT